MAAEGEPTATGSLSWFSLCSSRAHQQEATNTRVTHYFNYGSTFWFPLQFLY